jgi:hypothetical protein
MAALHSTEVLAVVCRIACILGLSKTWNLGATKSLSPLCSRHSTYARDLECWNVEILVTSWHQMLHAKHKTSVISRCMRNMYIYVHTFYQTY